MSVDRERLARVARAQSGLFTRQQARECGFSAFQIKRRIAAGEWRLVAGPTLSYAGLLVTPRLRDRAVQLAVRGSVLAGPSAARWWKIPVGSNTTHLYVGRHGNTRLPGVSMIFEEPDQRDVLRWDGALMTSRERTVFDCLRILPDDRSLDLLDRALQQRWITLDDLVNRVRLHTGRRGSRRLARLLRRSAAGSRFAAERLLGRQLHLAGIRGWLANAPIADSAGIVGIGDIVFEALKLVIEVDGWAFHVTPERFQRDRERQNRLIAAGWTVLRFTWRDLTDRPEYVIRTILNMLAHLGAGRV